MLRLALLKLTLLTGVLLATGCNNSAATSEPDPAASETVSTPLNLCTDPRPEICTQQYDPVCATLKDGSQKTYASGCTACSDSSVVGWLPGECR